MALTSSLYRPIGHDTHDTSSNTDEKYPGWQSPHFPGSPAEPSPHDGIDVGCDDGSGECRGTIDAGVKLGSVKGADTAPNIPPKLRKLDARLLETPTEAARSDVTIAVYTDAFLYVTEYLIVVAAVATRDRNNFCCWE